MKKRLILLSVAVLLLTASAVLVAGQSAGKLSRDKARKLIEASNEMSRPATEEIWLGRDFRRTDYLRSISWDLADDMVALGYLEKQGKDYVLGPEGRKVEAEWIRNESLPKSRLIPIATRRVIQVTGITYDEKGVAQVEFEWQYIWTKFGGLIADGTGSSTQRIYDKYSPYNNHKGVAFMRAYDDGWRVGMVSLAR